MPPKFSAYLVILWFERRYPKQNTVARLKSNIVTPKILGWPCDWLILLSQVRICRGEKKDRSEHTLFYAICLLMRNHQVAAKVSRARKGWSAFEVWWSK